MVTIRQLAAENGSVLGNLELRRSNLPAGLSRESAARVQLPIDQVNASLTAAERDPWCTASLERRRRSFGYVASREDVQSPEE